jgi:hypothetical protein
MLNFNRLIDGDISLEDLPSPIKDQPELISPDDQNVVKIEDIEVNQQGEQ